MALFSDFEDEKPEEPPPVNYIGLVIFVMTLPVLLFFSHIGKTDMGLSVGICLGMNILAILIRWDLRKHFWFWTVMVVVLAIELPLILRIQWPRRWVPGVELFPIGIAGLLIALGAIKFVERFIVKAAPSGEDK